MKLKEFPQCKTSRINLRIERGTRQHINHERMDVISNFCLSNFVTFCHAPIFPLFFLCTIRMQGYCSVFSKILKKNELKNCFLKNAAFLDSRSSWENIPYGPLTVNALQGLADLVGPNCTQAKFSYQQPRTFFTFWRQETQKNCFSSNQPNVGWKFYHCPCKKIPPFRKNFTMNWMCVSSKKATFLLSKLVKTPPFSLKLPTLLDMSPFYAMQVIKNYKVNISRCWQFISVTFPLHLSPAPEFLSPCDEK